VRGCSKDFPRLLAKTEVKENGVTKAGCFLLQHSLDVVEAASKIIEVAGADLSRFFKLSDSQQASLMTTSLVASLLHDIGKANDGFQKMLAKSGEQIIRHEHLSALFMSVPEVKTWLEKIPDLDFEIARLAVAGYHLKLAGEENKDKRFVRFAERLKRSGDVVLLCSDHRDFAAILNRLCDEPFKRPQPDFSVPSKWSFSAQTAGESVSKQRKRILEEFGDFVDDLETRAECDDHSRMGLFMAVKAVLIAADASASGLRRKERDVEISIKEWIEETLSAGSTAGDVKQIIRKRVIDVVARKRAKDPTFKFRFHNFQKKASRLGGRALLLSSCGSGKTLAAWRWIKKQLSQRPGLKVAFLYPTTNTAAQGFKDYASHDKTAALVSSRAEFDLERMFRKTQSVEDSSLELEGMLETPDERGEIDYSTDRELYALGYWPKHIFSSTVDAFLGFTQNNYSSLCLLPVLARSVVVIDEVHSFDPAMFSALLEFLEKFDCSVLMMTASLQKERLDRLLRVCPDLQVYPQEEDYNKDLQDLMDANDFKRYFISRKKEHWAQSDKDFCPKEMLSVARNAHSVKRKVLWVVNSVDRCMSIAKELSDLNAFCYHSRFIYVDRVEIHNEVVKQFSPDYEAGVIAVTTQVCEMSLDLDADVLITELAPASSLIQRMGRCNRDQKGRDPYQHGEIYIYAPPLNKKQPYREEVFDTGEALLCSLKLDTLVAQSDLSTALEKVARIDEREHVCKFTTPTWKSYCENDFRETDDYTVSAILESMVDEFLRLKKERKNIEGIVIQSPFYLTLKERHEGIWPRIVPDMSDSGIRYCKNFGLRKGE